MSTEEIKFEINKVLDQLSDKSLNEVLSLLRRTQESKSMEMFDPELISKILVEDKELLQKLAQ